MAVIVLSHHVFEIATIFPCALTTVIVITVTTTMKLSRGVAMGVRVDVGMALALRTWRRPALAEPDTNVGRLHDEISRHFDLVQIHADPEPSTLALHHTRRTRSAPSVIARAAATNPRPPS
jgi:hypothetical protein